MSKPIFCSQKTGFDSSCKLSPEGTICMKYQRLLSMKNKRNISKYHLLKILPSMLGIKVSLCFGYILNIIKTFHQCVIKESLNM